MGAKDRTIEQTIEEIRTSLRDYIEATYHISDPALVRQRSALLDQQGVLAQAPYLESTPRYVSKRRFAELDLPAPAKELLTALAHPASGEPLVHDPPYTHQAEALEATIRDGRSLVVTTGTGSGKTESFLLPTAAKLAIEAATRPDSFCTPAVRAIVLYPMNALVNDQLGRLRLLFGDPQIADWFIKCDAARPARFARYTSRTLYPGVRTRERDQDRLKSIDDFYLELQRRAAHNESQQQKDAQDLIQSLRERGKWPAKPDLAQWYGADHQRWIDPASGRFQRAVTLREDPELLTRHEVLENPPDLLVTNYSMLEYMLMRPLERPIFDATRDWLADNPQEKLLLVIDEAHLYRGAAGAEVALLLRRLRARLDIPIDRVQIICTSASFADSSTAATFAAQLTGQHRDQFQTITGQLRVLAPSNKGTQADAAELAAVPLNQFYNAADDTEQRRALNPFLRKHAPEHNGPVHSGLYVALKDYPPLNLLVNRTMTQATPVSELGQELFATDDAALAEQAVTALVALASVAREHSDGTSLLPCRIHTFFRGLPGLWACIDPDCTQVPEPHRGGPTGALYAQPRETCVCGARAFELYTCRNCGSAYARAYTNDVIDPQYLWSDPGVAFRSHSGTSAELSPLDMLLEPPTDLAKVDPHDLDLRTGRFEPDDGRRTRRVHVPRHREVPQADEEDDEPIDVSTLGQFRPCGVCDTTAPFNRSSVQDHQTKGEPPFQALVTRQIEVQTPSSPPSEFAPLRGRKVLIFSDSRQSAARLAPNLQTFSMRDVARPLIMQGWRELATMQHLASGLCLEDLYLAVLLGSSRLHVRLGTELADRETRRALRAIETVINRNDLDSPAEQFGLTRAIEHTAPPQSLLASIVGSYSAGMSAGGSHAPVVNSCWSAASLSRPHFTAVSR